LNCGGGQNWGPTKTTAEGAPFWKTILNSTGDSSYGGWVKTISVSPVDAKTVALAWGRSCISNNGGQSWRMIAKFLVSRGRNMTKNIIVD